MALDLGLDKVGAHFERFSRLPRKYRLAALPLICLVVLGAYAYLFYLPAQEKLSQLHAQERDLQRKLSEVKAIVSNVEAFEQELAALERRLREALRQLPNSKELPVLLTDVTSLAKDAGLELRIFRPRVEVARDFYAEVPIEIEFSGGYHDIARFFEKVSKLPRIVNVGKLEMSIASQGSEGTRLEVNGEATTFRFLEQEAAAPAPAASAGGVPSRGGRKS